MVRLRSDDRLGRIPLNEMLAAAIALGGHVGLGVADYPYPELGYPTTAQLVGYVAEMARYMGREVATAAEAREMLNMK